MKGLFPGRKAASNLLPPLAGLLLVFLFTNLGFWQLDRGEEKRALEKAFTSPGKRLTIAEGLEPDLYQPLRVTGRYLGERQFLIDNSILGGRLGYFVITPLEFSTEAPLLLVNRGWFEKKPGNESFAPLAIHGDEHATGEILVTGRAGRLPRVGIRAGEPFQKQKGWPKVANWPTLDELANALDREVLPFVLLADPQPATGLVREWRPQQAGPARHIGYAVQWFALALTVIVIGVLMYIKKRKRDEA